MFDLAGPKERNMKIFSDFVCSNVENSITLQHSKI
jgi:hypothetical protein